MQERAKFYAYVSGAKQVAPSIAAAFVLGIWGICVCPIIARAGIPESASVFNASLIAPIPLSPSARIRATLPGLHLALPLSDAVDLRRQITDSWRAAHIVGTASTYNPDGDEPDAGGAKLASGERYDAGAWTAAVQLQLRSAFGGVGYRRDYRPCFALISVADQTAIVRINDVGPLRPGRVIDLSERAMRYFDQSLRRGLIEHTTVVPLPGQHWPTGPWQGGIEIPMGGDFRHDG